VAPVAFILGSEAFPRLPDHLPFGGITFLDGFGQLIQAASPVHPAVLQRTTSYGGAKTILMS